MKGEVQFSIYIPCVLIDHLAIESGKQKAFGGSKHLDTYRELLTWKKNNVLAIGAQIYFHRLWYLPNSWNRLFRPIMSKHELITHYSFYAVCYSKLNHLRRKSSEVPGTEALWQGNLDFAYKLKKLNT